MLTPSPKTYITASDIKAELMVPIKGPHFTHFNLLSLEEPLYRISLIASLVFDTKQVEAAHKLMFDPRAFKQCLLDYGSSPDLIAHVLANKSIVDLPTLAQDMLEQKRKSGNWWFRLTTNKDLNHLKELIRLQEPRRSYLDSILGYSEDQHYNDVIRLGQYYTHLAKQIAKAEALSAAFRKRVFPYLQARDLPLLKIYSSVAYLTCLRYTGNEEAQIHNFIRNRPITNTTHYQRELYQVPIYAGPREDIKGHVVDLLTSWLGRLHENSKDSRKHKRFFKKIRSILLDLNNLQLFKLSKTHRKQVIERFNYLLQVSAPK